MTAEQDDRRARVRAFLADVRKVSEEHGFTIESSEWIGVDDGPPGPSWEDNFADDWAEPGKPLRPHERYPDEWEPTDEGPPGTYRYKGKAP